MKPKPHEDMKVGKKKKKAEEEVRQMSRTPSRKNWLLLIAGGIQGVPRSVSTQPVGRSNNTESADVGGTMTPNAERMVRFKLVRQPPLKTTGLADIDRENSLPPRWRQKI